MEEAPDKVKLRRFVRRADENTLTETDRDLAIAFDLYRLRFMSTAQFKRLYGAAVDNRLLRLFKNGLVDRPDAQRVFRMREGGGSKPLVYALTNAGADALSKRHMVKRRGRFDWNEANRNLSRVSSLI